MIWLPMQFSGEVSHSVRVSGTMERRQLAAPVMADANKRINLAAPLISARRHGAGDADVDGEETHPGGVPFRWEQRPGHPKSVRTRRAPPPARNDELAMAVVAVAAAAPVLRDEARFSDALSSVAESCVTVNCSSATGISDAVRPAAARAAANAGGVMMDRFLPAAHAVAVLSPPQCTSRKAGIAAAAANAARNNHRDVLPRLLPPPEPSPPSSPTSHALCIVPTMNTDDADAAAVDDEDDGDWDAHSVRGSSSRRCGLLLPKLCMKSTMLLLNPAPAMRRRRRDRRIPLLSNSKIGRGQSMANPLVRSTRNGKHDDPIAMQSWEEVYINSLRRSGRGGGRKGLGALLSPSPSPELDKTTTVSPSVRELYLEQGDGGVHPKSTHLGFLLVFDDDDNHFSHVSDEPKLLPPPHIPRPPVAPKVFDGGKKPRRDAGGGYGWPLLLEDDTAASRDVVAAPLLPPLPSPKSPSESWLSRAMPSMSSNPPATSFLGLHVQLKKQATSPWCSSRSGQAKVVVDDHARPRRMRIHDLHKA